MVMMERAKILDDTWKERQVIHVRPKVDKELNQGGLIELASGRWYVLSHQGTAAWEGRAFFCQLRGSVDGRSWGA